MTLEALDAEVSARGGAAAVVAEAQRREPRPLDLRALASRKAPPREWAIDGWLPRSGPALLAGPGGKGKSLLAQQVATMQALGRDFIGKAHRPASVLLWNCEDEADELWRRQEAISEHFGMPLDEPGNDLRLVSRVGHENTLMAPLLRTGVLSPTNVFARLREQLNDEEVDQLWLDNAAHVYAGNPDDRNEVTTFVNGLLGAVVGRPFAVVIVTHTARAQGSEFAGSAAWENAARVRWYFGDKLPDQRADDDEPVDPKVRYLARRKSNYSGLDHLRLTMLNGVLVPDQGPAAVGALVSALDEQQVDSVVVAGFKSLQAMGIAPTDGKTSPDFLPRQILEKGLACGYGKADLSRAMNRLMARGVFIRGQIGTYANRSPKLGLVLNEGAS